jgi:hypothetical protein
MLLEVTEQASPMHVSPLFKGDYIGNVLEIPAQRRGINIALRKH